MAGDDPEVQEKVYLLEDGAQCFWKGHSDRATLSTLAAAIDISKSRRDRLGRWLPKESDEYTRNTKAIVLAVQKEVAVKIRTAKGVDTFGEVHVLTELATFCESRHMSQSAIDAMLARLAVAPPEADLAGGSDAGIFTPIPVDMDPGSGSDDGFGPVPETDEVFIPVPQLSDGVYVASQCRAGKDLTLHCVGKCWRIPGVHYARYVELDSTEIAQVNSNEKVFNRVCSDCFPKGLKPEKVVADDKIDSSDSSDSGEDSESDA